jgi:hypothetical protein
MYIIYFVSKLYLENAVYNLKINAKDDNGVLK